MGGYVEFSVFLACLSCILNFYASFITFFGVLGHLLLFLLISCALFGIVLRFRIPKPKESTAQNVLGGDWSAYKFCENKIENNYVMKVVAHRACGLDAPENSLSAVRKINKEGIKAVEFDVMLTADKVPIVFHDETLTRMTDVCKTVRETTFEEIRKLDISVNHPFGKNYRDEKIPSLEEFVLFCLENEMRMFMDLKDGDRNLIVFISNLFKQYPKMYDLTVISAFNPTFIYKIRTKDPKIVCSLAWRPYFYSHEEYCDPGGPSNVRTTNLVYLLYLRALNVFHQWALWKFGYYLLGLSAVLLHKDMITREMIYYWEKRGVRVIAWNVNLPTEKQYFEKILGIAYLTDTVINS